MFKNPIMLLLMATLALALPLCLSAQDQKLTTTAADDLAAQQITSLNIIASRSLTDAGRNARDADLIVTDQPADGDADRPHGPALFPADLAEGATSGQPLQTTTLHNIYINQSPSAWGDPVGFLHDLNDSQLIHITDQYVGVEFNHRYPLGTSFLALVTPGAGFPPAPNNIITIPQIISLLHAAGTVAGTGHDHVYNVFIPPGDDVCLSSTSCFSPDHPSTFAFCAFHSFVRFSDIGQVLLTVLPETGVPGCASQQPSPNGIVADSVDSTMSHELFETITDPDLNEWFVRGDLDLRGAEIGDVCQPTGNSQRQFLVPTFNVHGHPYAIQLEYSNLGHGCFSRPVDPN